MWASRHPLTEPHSIFSFFFLGSCALYVPLSLSLFSVLLSEGALQSGHTSIAVRNSRVSGNSGALVDTLSHPLTFWPLIHRLGLIPEMSFSLLTTGQYDKVWALWRPALITICRAFYDGSIMAPGSCFPLFESLVTTIPTMSPSHFFVFSIYFPPTPPFDHHPFLNSHSCYYLQHNYYLVFIPPLVFRFVLLWNVFVLRYVSICFHYLRVHLYIIFPQNFPSLYGFRVNNTVKVKLNWVAYFLFQ